MIYLDAGTTYSKIITIGEVLEGLEEVKTLSDRHYYVIPSAKIKGLELNITRACGHMAKIGRESCRERV